MRAQYAMVQKDFEHNIIFIEDIANHTGGCTITNDAEAVFKHVDEMYSPVSPTPFYWRVIYKDTNNEWWEMIPTYDEIGDRQRHIIFDKWHGHEWDALKGRV